MYGVTRQPLGTSPPVVPLEEKVYEAADERQGLSELRRLNRRTLSTFVELLRTMQQTPTQSETKVAEIRTLLLNMEHLLNSFRAYQAREDLIAAVRAQVEAKQAIIDELRDASAACTAAMAVTSDGDDDELDNPQEPPAGRAAAVDAGRNATASGVEAAAARALLEKMVRDG